MTKLTKAQRARLDKLATYLEGLPADYQHFAMDDYMGLDANDPVAINYALHNGGVPSCGTAACAVGHGPAAGILVPKRLVGPRWRGDVAVDWDAYAELFTGDDYALYRWCFSGNWDQADNTHFGAAARIRCLLAVGAPSGWDYDAQTVAIYAPYRVDSREAINA